MERRRKKRYTTMAQINLTNLVDVSLVLLIIFILTAPVIKEGIEVSAPKAAASEQLSDAQDPIIVLVTHQKHITVNNEVCTEESVAGVIESLYTLSPRPVRLKADQDLPYGFVIGILDSIRARGVTQVSLITRPLGEATSRTQ